MSGEIVHEQTVRAPIPVAPIEVTVRAPMPVPPAQEQTVRAFVPSAVPSPAAPAPEVEELEEVDVEPETEAEPGEPRGFDVGALVSELEARVRRISSEDVPVARADQITAPEAAVKTSELLSSVRPEPRPRGKRRRDEGPALRPEPPAVSGEVSVSEPEPGDLFGPAPSRREARVQAPAAVRSPTPRRDDPPLVSGEVAIDPAAAKSPEVPAPDVRVKSKTLPAPQAMMPSSGSQPIVISSGSQAAMASSGSHPIMSGSAPRATMTSSGSHPIMIPAGAPGTMTASGASPVVPRRPSTDGGIPVHGPADTTGPLRVVRARRGEGSRDSLVLWVLAGTLVVLAVGVVMLVLSWAQ